MYALPPAEPERADLEARRERTIVQGGWSKADVWMTTLPSGRRVVVKDFSGKPLLGRAWGWIQVRRERKMLRILRDLEQVPALVAELGSLALVIEYVGGMPLYRCTAEERQPVYLEQLGQMLSQMRERGVIHNDLRGRENVHLLADEQRIVILDWAGGVFLRPGSRLHRWAFDGLRVADEAALVKWKQMFWPEMVSEADQRLLRRFRRWRVLWPFNRKGVGRVSPVPNRPSVP